MNEFVGYLFIAVMTLNDPQQTPSTYKEIQVVDRISTAEYCRGTQIGAQELIGTRDRINPRATIQKIDGICVPVTATQLANMVDSFRILRRTHE